ncbi:hypothetical protein N7510_004196 [Penicillium lagena]|uniref:uncharacterized protein n=1 Tax=Penicillium lagena TaxID=94218 RepID=UPI0025418413|nr:uncharacterized protein N7510_004196 [Penicillium lagena]KAJ5620212.1 hypothetical protein N7510_004196 [Penicillium lagena]
MPDDAIPSSRISRSPPRSSSSPDSIFSAWRERLLNWWSYTSSAPFESYSQIPQSDFPLDQPPNQLPRREDDPKMELLRLDKARWRTYWLATVLCCGGALFGYDSGVIGTVLPILTEFQPTKHTIQLGGVLTFSSFQDSFQIPAAKETKVSSIAVGIQQAGAFVGCFLIWPVTNRLGRRMAMALCSLVFCIGVVLEVIDTHSLPAFYVGRVICGLGIGGSATVIPIYMSEMSPKEIRGRLGSCYQLSYTIGILVSYWIDYGVKYMAATPAQWQIPIGLQLVPGAMMGLGMLSLDESVRWLLAKGKTAEAWRSIVWIRAGDSQAVADEFAEIRHGLEEEKHATAGFKLSELLEGPNRQRLLIAGGLFLAQQSTGSTALAYFGPQFFSILVGPGDKNLLLTGIFGAIKVVSCLLFVLFMSDRFGRKPVLAGGAIFMSICMVITAAVVKTHSPSESGPVTSAGIATVALIYLDIMAYNFSWGPLPWPCTSEIFPTRIREPGVAFGVGAQWLFNFVWSFSTPYIMAGIGWGTFLLFGGLDVLIFLFTIFCLKETVGKSLEEINEMFDGQSIKNIEGDDEQSYSADSPSQYLDAEPDSISVAKVSTMDKASDTHVEESTAGRA